MKTLRLIFEFFSRSKIPAVIIVIIFTGSLFIANYSISILRYITYSRNVLVNTETVNSLYCMPFMYDEDETSETVIDEIEKKAKKYEAYTPFKRTWNFNALINGVNVKNSLFTEEMIDSYKLPLSKGNWNDLMKESSDCFNVIASGRQFNYLNVGDTLDMKLPDVIDKSIKIKIVGILANPSIVPQFNTAGSEIDSMQLYEYVNGMVFYKSNRLNNTLNEIAGYDIISTQNNFFTSFKPTATETEKDKYYSFLSEYSAVATYNEILDNTDDRINSDLRRTIPMPIFLLLIVTLSLISLSVLFVNKQLRMHSIYYLCGCSIQKLYFIISCAIGLMGSIGGLLNIIYVLNYYFLADCLISSLTDNLIYDENIVIFTVIYTIVISAISIVLSILVFRKSSPIEIYRKYAS